LGSDVFKKGAISEQKAIDFERTMIAFEQLMKVHKVNKYRACATSAMRDAANGNEIIQGVKERTDINIEIISGDEEAKIIRSTHIEERLEKNHDFLYVDVGGGSTEVSFYKNGELDSSHSFNIGTIRLLNDQVTDAQWTAMQHLDTYPRR
jgi:exopolyphosphatase/guanosine-5'-triphosphate,3'-diphosphate pyrophosphatase